MPDKKLTDSEIVKAWECCASGDGGCEKGCPLHKDCKSPVLTMEWLISNALDLINRLQKDKEYYKQCRNECLDKVMFIAKQYDELQAENERLRGHQKDGFFNLLGNCLVFSKTLEDYNDMRKGLKAEAIKEFVERLKERADKLKHISIDGKWAISQYDVDKLLKEKVGSDLF